jgi:hypothetical protein
MRPTPFSLSGPWYRGNVHTHSTLSDGRKTPAEVCAFYEAMGYHFIAITDHFLEAFGYPIADTRPYRSAAFTTLLGAELHAGQITSGEPWHILAVGLPPDFAPNLPDETGPALAARAKAAGAMVTVAHPAWYALTEDDVISLGDVHAIETITGISHDHSDRVDSWYMLDAMLARGRRYLALTTDDAHFHALHGDILHGWIYARAAALDPDALLAALKAGDYYCSSGPQIFDLEFTDTTLHIRCSPADSIFITGEGARSVYLHGNGLIEAEMSLARLKNSRYARVTVRDSHGGRAWTNPIFFDE